MLQILKNNHFVNSSICATQFGVNQVKLMDHWYGKCHAASVVDVARVNQFGGGLKFKAIYQKETGYVYVRQFIYDLMEYSGKTLELTVDFWCDTPIGVDVYVNARPNDNLASRVVVCDTDTITYPKGRNIHKCIINMPDLYGKQGFLDCLSKDNMIEFAFRFIGSDKTANITVNKAELTTKE